MAWEEKVEQEVNFPFIKSMDQKLKDPTLAGILSFFVPGMGHIYIGHPWQGISLLIITGFGFLLFIIPGIILWIFAIWDAVDTAKKDNKARDLLSSEDNQAIKDAPEKK